MSKLDRVVMVWLGAFGPKKPFGARPGDAWIEAWVMEDNPSGHIMVERCDNNKNIIGGIRIVPPDHWRERTEKDD